MARYQLDTVTETSTEQKIAVGFIVATASLVAVSVIAAALYTLGFNASVSSVVTTIPTVEPAAEATDVIIPATESDRSFTTPN